MQIWEMLNYNVFVNVTHDTVDVNTWSVPLMSTLAALSDQSYIDQSSTLLATKKEQDKNYFIMLYEGLKVKTTQTLRWKHCKAWWYVFVNSYVSSSWLLAHQWMD